jgi:hypothetical protein
MPNYRIYLMSDDNHIVGTPKFITSGSDAEAIASAQDQLDDRIVEVWEGARLVKRLRPIEDATRSVAV